MEPVLIFVVFLAGTSVGSFLNVCIYRLPRGLSPHLPLFSFCPKCKKNIRCYDNLPIISYILLRGRCRRCGARIAVHYPLVEALTGLLALAALLRFGISLIGLWAFAFFSALLVIAFIDGEHMFIPDSLSIGGTLVALLLSPLALNLSFLDAMLGALSGAGFIFIVNYIYLKVAGRDGFGWGDVKLLAFVGAALGWQSLFWVVFISSFLGSLTGAFMLIYQIGVDALRRQIPFAPFVAVAAVFYLLCKDVLPRLFWF